MAVRCPGCSRTLNVAKASAGKTFSCPQCTTKFRVPAAATGDFDFSSNPGPSDPFAGIEPSELASVPLGPSSYTGTPSYRGYGAHRSDNREVWSYVVPGAAILAMSVLNEAYGVFYLVSAVVQFQMIMNLPGRELAIKLSQLLVVLVLMAVYGFAIHGAICMIRRVDLAAAKTAAVISCLPCSLCCVFQMGVGIWAAISVFSDQARRDFR